MKQFFAAFLVLVITAHLSYAQSNSAQITQTADNTHSTVIQTGDFNDAVVYIYRDWSASSIQQIGNDNTATQYLTGDGPLLYEIEQNGEGNTAVQDDSASIPDYNKDWKDPEYLGDYDWTNISASVLITQDGDYNEAYQYGTKFYAEIYQGGSFNEAIQNQTDINNKAAVNQLGYSNYVNQLQEGTGNSALSFQEGYNLTHNLWQQGNDLYISVSQTNLNPAYTPGPINIKQY